jgi:AcrR family transcriptional regulator
MPIVTIRYIAQAFSGVIFGHSTQQSMTNTRDIWLDAGYTAFARGGETGLKVEALAREIGISKSSFYHHFADADLFIEQLLQRHLQQCRVIARKEQNARNINPELIDILIAHRADLLFNRQLRILQHRTQFGQTLKRANEIVGNEFVRIWKQDLALPLTVTQLEGLFTLALENFYLQINEDTLNSLWLAQYFSNLKAIAQKFV